MVSTDSDPVAGNASYRGDNDMQRTQIKSFRIENYRNIAKAELDFSEGVVGLIGVNASGKTNIGRAFEFFCEFLYILAFSSDDKSWP